MGSGIVILAHDQDGRYPQCKSKSEVALWERRTPSVLCLPETRVGEAKRVG